MTTPDPALDEVAQLAVLRFNGALPLNSTLRRPWATLSDDEQQAWREAVLAAVVEGRARSLAP